MRLQSGWLLSLTAGLLAISSYAHSATSPLEKEVLARPKPVAHAADNDLLIAQGVRIPGAPETNDLPLPPSHQQPKETGEAQLAPNDPKTAQETFTLDRVFFVSPPMWYVLEKRSLEGTTLVFRRYAVSIIDEKIVPEKVKNIFDYGCQRTNQYSDYIVFHFPGWIKFESINRTDWLPRMDLRVALNNLEQSFSLEGEFRNGELFIDLNNQSKENMMRMLGAEEAILDFGSPNERLSIIQASRTPDGKGNIGGFIEETVSLISSAVGGGAVRSMNTDAMLHNCMRYKRSGRY